MLATVIVTKIAAGPAHGETKYPDWAGQWAKKGQASPDLRYFNQGKK
jgi:hypothetical protein